MGTDAVAGAAMPFTLAAQRIKRNAYLVVLDNANVRHVLIMSITWLMGV